MAASKKTIYEDYTPYTKGYNPDIRFQSNKNSPF